MPRIVPFDCWVCGISHLIDGTHIGSIWCSSKQTSTAMYQSTSPFCPSWWRAQYLMLHREEKLALPEIPDKMRERPLSKDGVENVMNFVMGENLHYWHTFFFLEDGKIE